MKTLFTYFFFALAPLFSIAQGERKVLMLHEYDFRTDIEPQEVKGPKKAISVEIYGVSQKDTNISKKTKTINWEYDRDGNCIYEKTIKYEDDIVSSLSFLKSSKNYYEEIYFEKDSANFKKEVWKRKNKRYAFRHISYSPLDTGDAEDEVTITKHNGKLVIKRERSSWHGITQETRTNYSKNHKPLQQNYSSGGKPWLRKSWVYDGDGTLTEDTATYIKNGKITYQSICRYDKQGNVIERLGNNVEYSSNGIRLGYRYDTANREVEWIQYEADGSYPTKGISIFDANGLLIRKIYEDTLGKLDFERIYSYDINGRKIEEMGSRADSTYSYKRANVWGKSDPYGNWESVIEYLDGVPKLITIRKIEYY